MKDDDLVLHKTLELVHRMNEIADEGDSVRRDTGCGVLYGVVRDSAYKIKQLAELEQEVHRNMHRLAAGAASSCIGPCACREGNRSKKSKSH